MRCHHPGGVTSQLCHVVKLLGIYSMGIIVEKVADFSGLKPLRSINKNHIQKSCFSCMISGNHIIAR